MNVIGVELAWTPSGGTGLCLIADGRAVESTRISTDAEILAWLRPLVADRSVVAIDAPLIVRNLTGRRRGDQLISQCFGAQHASTHSANLGLDSFRNGVRGERIAAALELDVDPGFEPRILVRRAIEVYPHPASCRSSSAGVALGRAVRAGRSRGGVPQEEDRNHRLSSARELPNFRPRHAVPNRVPQTYSPYGARLGGR